MTELSPEGRPQPAFIHAYLDARKAAGLPAPLEMWDTRNGWLHYRDEYGASFCWRRSHVERMARELNARTRA